MLKDESDKKYIVFKREDWKQFLRQMGMVRDMECVATLAPMLDYIRGHEVDDGEVIRHQDVTAAPIFHHYASTLRTIVEVAENVGFIDIDYTRLSQVADHFSEAATASELLPKRKLPD